VAAPGAYDESRSMPVAYDQMDADDTFAAQSYGVQGGHDTEDMSDLRVVDDYQYDAGGTQATKMMVDPISGKVVAAEDMTEHMRVQLLDPKWRQQQHRFLEKQKETGYAAGGSIADSLKVFARKRGDIFGQAASGSGPDSAAAIAKLEEADVRRSEVFINIYSNLMFVCFCE
jgi:hypothetical protein